MDLKKFAAKGQAAQNAADNITKAATVLWLIWSNEHNAWWAPGSKGYVKNKDEAGRFEFGRAVDIVMAANTSDGRYFKRQHPDETMCPDWKKGE